TLLTLKKYLDNTGGKYNNIVSSLPVAVESIKASAEPAWQISGFFLSIWDSDESYTMTFRCLQQKRLRIWPYLF
ncbi:MAG: hypothetical protein CVT95_13470, partial [Bacteroidetes bacterium HGW-Bacteroidetes-12]